MALIQLWGPKVDEKLAREIATHTAVVGALFGTHVSTPISVEKQDLKCDEYFSREMYIDGSLLLWSTVRPPRVSGSVNIQLTRKNEWWVTEKYTLRTSVFTTLW